MTLYTVIQELHGDFAPCPIIFQSLESALGYCNEMAKWEAQEGEGLEVKVVMEADGAMRVASIGCYDKEHDEYTESCWSIWKADLEINR